MKSHSAILGILLKDIHSEFRTRYAINALSMFVVIAVATILFALRDDQVSTDVLSGMLWVVIFFTGMSGLSRSFISEEERGTVLTLQLVATPNDIFIAKLLVNTILTILFTGVVALLFLLTIDLFVVHSYTIFIVTLFLGACGFSCVSTIMAAIIAKAHSKGTLYPVLSFPVLIPLLMMVMRATMKALEGYALSDAFGDFQIMIAYILVVASLSYILFPFIWKD